MLVSYIIEIDVIKSIRILKLIYLKISLNTNESRIHPSSRIDYGLLLMTWMKLRWSWNKTKSVYKNKPFGLLIWTNSA